MVLIAGFSAGCQNGERSNSGETSAANGGETSNEATDATTGGTEEETLIVAAIETAYGACFLFCLII